MIFLASLIVFLAVVLLIPLARALAIKNGFVDAPGGRKLHEQPVPPIGGLVIFPVYMIVMIAAGAAGADLRHVWILFAGIAALVITGGIDDRRHVPAWMKFVIQLSVSSFVVLSGAAQMHYLGDLFGLGDFGLGFMSIPFSLVAFILLINAVNLIDGLDGLAAGYGFVVLFWLALASAFAGSWNDVLAIAPLMAALAGFLVYNLRTPFRRRASVFLGDAGSMALGLCLGYFCITLAQIKHEIIHPISVAWILAFPIMDTCAQFYRRVREGKHPFTPDRGHFHHHFVHAGLSDGAASAVILCFSFVMGGIGYVGVAIGIPAVVLTLLWTALLFVHIVISRRPEIYIRLFEKTFSKRSF